jgi:hypothetical protein
MKRWLCCLLTVAAFAVLAQDLPTIRVTTRLVEVTVVALGARGPVPDLRKDDFRVFENGVERPIAFFSVNTVQPPPKRLAPDPPNTFTNRLEQPRRRRHKQWQQPDPTRTAAPTLPAG